jgi:chromosome segregation ATPase
MYEIIADPDDYAIGALEEGFGHGQIPFPDNKRKKWAEEIGAFVQKLDSLSDKARNLKKLLFSESAIMATPASLKTFKVQLFKINDALNTAFDLAQKLETDIVKKG